MVLLVRFGELGLKSAFVRRQFQDRLSSNIHEHLLLHRIPALVRHDHARFYVHTDEEKRAGEALSHVFGSVSSSPAVESAASLDALSAAAVQFFSDRSWNAGTFAVRPRRQGSHPYRSPDVAKRLGTELLTAFPELRVDLDGPDHALHVEIRENRAYLFYEVWRGPGGLPVGTQGNVLAPLEDERDLLACWLMLKRGCEVLLAGDPPAPLMEVLRSWHPKIRAVDGPATMETAKAHRCLSLVSSRSLGNLPLKDEEKIPTLFPLVGWSEEEISSALARARGVDLPPLPP